MQKEQGLETRMDLRTHEIESFVDRRYFFPAYWRVTPEEALRSVYSPAELEKMAILLRSVEPDRPYEDLVKIDQLDESGSCMISSGIVLYELATLPDLQHLLQMNLASRMQMMDIPLIRFISETHPDMRRPDELQVSGYDLNRVYEVLAKMSRVLSNQRIEGDVAESVEEVVGATR